ncbi:hypothetical protein [Desulfobacter curvatus]|uniref:hypothetical protein n=1 Tax=Desulfobacter curvatus TaxID=2290 RepID=UPI0003690993|nr:hypothetical protein [Desulfobacter curvatus]
MKHEILRQNGHQFTEQVFNEKRIAYDMLAGCLAPAEGVLNNEDLHELMSRFMDILHPENA